MLKESEVDPLNPSHFTYELTHLLSNIYDFKTQAVNLVAEIRTEATYPQGLSGWFLFNDFFVKPIESPATVGFDPSWRRVCVVNYTRTLPTLPPPLLRKQKRNQKSKIKNQRSKTRRINIVQDLG